MLFIKGNSEGDQAQATYLIGEDMEAMIDKSVDRRLSDHGYLLGERAELLKDMGFLRRRRQLTEHLSKQVATWLVHGILAAIGMLALLGLKGYFI